MPIPVSCPSCRSSGQVPDEALGNQLTCPVCGTAFLLTRANAPVEMPNGVGVWVDSAHPTQQPVPTPAPLSPPQVAAIQTPALVAATTPPNAEVIPTPAPIPTPNEAETIAWLRAEKERFDAYVTKGLARLEQVRKENAEAESRHEAACVTRSIELSRQGTALDSRRQELDRREDEYRRAVEARAGWENEVARRDSELSEREAVVAHREGQKAELEAEAAELSRLISTLRPAVELLELRRTEAEGLRAGMAAKQTTLDRRLIEVGRLEIGLQKRLSELDELEHTLRAELEEREAELERQRAMLVEEVRNLRERVSVNHPTPMPRPALLPHV